MQKEEEGKYFNTGRKIFQHRGNRGLQRNKRLIKQHSFII
jgi:hypothetical protein